MTCIVGIKDPKTGLVHMGGDSAVSAGSAVQIRKDPKVFRLGSNMLVGMCGSIRRMQLLRFVLDVPEFRPTKTSVEKYLNTAFIDAVRACFDKGGALYRAHGEDYCDKFLVGFEGQLFEIDADFQIGTPATDYAACGSGAQVALGAMHATAGLDPVARVRRALVAAETFAAGVRGPFVIETLEG